MQSSGGGYYLPTNSGKPAQLSLINPLIVFLESEFILSINKLFVCHTKLFKRIPPDFYVFLVNPILTTIIMV